MGSQPGLKGAWLATQAVYPSEMAQNFWTAIWAFTVCFLVTVAVSLVTKAKPAAELTGLVYAYTEMPKDPPNLVWYQKPATLGGLILVAVTLLNILFW
jgi:SSS family solute:Na+ symporter